MVSGAHLKGNSMSGSQRQQELMTFWTILAERTCGGKNLVSSFDVICERLGGSPLAGVVRDLKESLFANTPLHEAMARHPDYFRRHVLCMVEGGERAGILDRMFVFILESAWRCPECILCE